ncbi:MAG TPA: hypothetical protein PLD25_31405 [Chloroflexota bacterium]|nr:hypothetical protein [Chloroflexota bacterium]HUM68240.1 hypothetical protein [Chloroflexota bacterium]
MIEMTETNKTRKQGRLADIVTAVTARLLTGICLTQMPISPYAVHTFMNHCGYESDQAKMAQAIARLKLNREV